jgi:hypothetical protein
MLMSGVDLHLDARGRDLHAVGIGEIWIESGLSAGS